MKNKQAKQMMLDGYSDKYLRTCYEDKSRSNWAFDRLRLFEDGMTRKKLRYPQLSKVSIKGNEK